MIFFFGALIAIVMCLLPLWMLPIACIALGYGLRWTWRQSFIFALMAGVLVIAAAAALDFQDQGLITKRMGGVFKIPPMLVPILPGLLMLWIGLFFTRLGASFRELIGRGGSTGASE